MATGHYAAISRNNEGLFLCEPKESRKSQIYFLALIDPSRLSRVVFPLADKSLEEVQAMTCDLPLVNRKESQDVCFLAGEGLSEYLSRELDLTEVKAGEIVDRQGKVLGTHQGLLHYTIGQRRGLRYAAGKRLYVVAKDSASKRLVLGEEAELLSQRVCATQAVTWRPLEPGEILSVKVRYQTQASVARVVSCSREGFELLLEKPVMSVTPGQIAVVYENDCIVAAGEIV